jgi:hypothetical protein
MIHTTFAQRRETREAFEKAESLGAKVTYNAPLPTLDRFQEELHCQAVPALLSESYGQFEVELTKINSTSNQTLSREISCVI